MKNLTKYLESKNFLANLFKVEPLTFPKDLQKIIDALDADMSPENVSCDGERPHSEVVKVMAFYRSVIKDIRDAGYCVGIDY